MLVCVFIFLELAINAHTANAQTTSYAKETKPSSGITVNDDSGQVLHIEQPANRVISLAPHLTELMYYIGAQDKLVGRDSASDYPEAAETIADIGNISLLNIEAILSLKPDLILAWKSGNTQKNLQRLQELGIPVFFSEPRSLDDIYQNMLSLASLTNSNKNKKKIVGFNAELNKFVTNKNQQEKTLRVFYQVWHKPLVTLNGEHLTSQMIALCGGYNIFSEEKILAPQINIESVIEANPQLIIMNNGQSENIWKTWKSIDAVKNNNFLYINPDQLRPGPRILEGFKKLCQAIENSK